MLGLVPLAWSALGAPLLSLMLWACEPPTPRFTPEDEIPFPKEVKAIRVIPPLVYAEIGDTFWVELVPLDERGDPYSLINPTFTWIDKPADVWMEEGFQGTWISVTSLTGAETRSTSEIRLKGKTLEGVPTVITVRVPGATSASQGDWLGADLGSLWPSDSRARRARPVIVLMDAEGGSGCIQDQRYSLAWGGFLDENKKDGCQPDGVEAAFFSSLAEAHLLEDPNGAKSVFSSAIDRILPALKEPKGVRLVFWDWALPAGQSRVDTMKAHLDYAQHAFTRSGAGITLDAGFSDNHDTAESSRTLNYEGPACEDAVLSALLRITGGELTKTGNAAIHVVYVERLLDRGRSISGAFCYWDASRLPVVLISESINTVGTLAHELGHIFGLNGRAMGESGGEAINIHGFDASNLMRGHRMGAPGNRELFTLGQVYRMHFDPRSWVRMLPPLPSSPSRCCQANPYSHDPCPPLWMAAWEVRDPTDDPHFKTGTFEDLPCPGGEP